MKKINSVILKKKQIQVVGLVFYGFFNYNIRGSVKKRYFFEMKRCFFEYSKSVFFFSFVEKKSFMFFFSEFRKRNFFFSFYKEEFNFLFIEHLLCLFFKVFFSVSGKKDFFLKRVVSFFFWFINFVSLNVVDESNSCSLLCCTASVVKESKVFPSLSEVESDKVVVCVNKRVSFFQAISLFCELIWNLNYLNFFFFENRRIFFFLGKILQSIFFFFEHSYFLFSFFQKRKQVNVSKKRFFFCNKMNNVLYDDLVAYKNGFFFKK